MRGDQDRTAILSRTIQVSHHLLSGAAVDMGDSTGRLPFLSPLPLQLWVALVPVRHALVAVGGAQHGRLVKRPADDLRGER